MSVSGRKRRYDVAFYVPSIGPLLVADEVPPTGGAETQIFLLAKALAKRGVRVCLVVFQIPGVRLPTEVDGVDIHTRPPYNAHQRFVGKLREAAAIRRVVPSLDADVLVGRIAGPHIGLLALGARLARMRFIYSSANVIDFNFARLARKRRNLALYRLGVKLADGVVVQTDEQARLCRDHFGRTAVVVRSIAEPAPVVARKPEAFLWIGRLVWYKQPLAFVELASSMPDATFRLVGVPVAGEEALAAEVQAAAARVPNLELLPGRPRLQLMDLIDRAAAIVNTSDFEGMPNIFLEGWSRGVPALALSHDPDRVIERHRLGEFAYGDRDRLRMAARALWSGRDSARGLEARCEQYVALNHSAEIVAARWHEVLAEVSSRSETASMLAEAS
jgi:glycosyltransferase involved in cell wall biosynthesis